MSHKIPDWNIKKFEEKLKKEVKHRKNFSNPIKKKSREEKVSSGLFEQFLLIGLPPIKSNDERNSSNQKNSTKVEKPEILVAYPPFEIPELPLSKIISYALPTGCKRNYLTKLNSFPIQDEFVFQIGDVENPYYGVCVHLTTSHTGKPFYGSKYSKQSTFCFLLITKIPVFSSHFSFLTYLSLLTVGVMKKVHEYDEIISVKFPPNLVMPIPDLDLDLQIGHHPLIPVPESFVNELASYYSSSLDSPPEIYSEDTKFELRFPKGSDANSNSVAWASLDTLFSILPVVDILTLITGILLDRQILVIGSRLQEVSMTIYALLSLIKPFEYSGTVIPLLPTEEDFLNILELPTPFLIGVPPCPTLRKLVFIESAIFVDLDKRSVPNVKNLPKFPDQNTIVTKLTKLLVKQKNSELGHPYGFPHIYSKYLNHKYTFTQKVFKKIEELFTETLNPVLGDLINWYFVTDLEAGPNGVTVFNGELFLSQIKESDKIFWQEFIDNQTFQLYIENKMQKFINEKIEKGESDKRPNIEFSSHRPLGFRARTKSLSLLIPTLPPEDTNTLPNPKRERKGSMLIPPLPPPNPSLLVAPKDDTKE